MDTVARLRCASCERAIIGDMTPREVVTLDGTSVAFRRHTDYVVCTCMSSYRVTDLREVIAQVEARTRSYTAS